MRVYTEYAVLISWNVYFNFLHISCEDSSLFPVPHEATVKLVSHFRKSKILLTVSFAPATVPEIIFRNSSVDLDRKK